MKNLIALFAIICAASATYSKPNEYAIMVVETILPADGRNVVMLRTKNEKRTRYLPIFVADAEAFNIYIRLAKESVPRPLTLDLFESTIRKANLRLIDVRIEQIVNDVFISRVLIKCPDGSTIDLDSRTSDAIGLALGLGAQIKINRKLLDKVGIYEDEIKQSEEPAYEETL